MSQKLNEILPSCPPMSCNYNVLRVYDRLSDEEKMSARIVLVAPLHGYKSIKPQAGRLVNTKSQWVFHAVVQYKNYILDPEDNFAMKPVDVYLREMLNLHPNDVGFWSFTYDEYMAGINSKGWLAVFNLLLNKPQIFLGNYENLTTMRGFNRRVDAENPFYGMQVNKKIRLRYWVTPSKDSLDGSYRECIEGKVGAILGRAITVKGQRKSISIPYEAIDSVGYDGQYMREWTKYYGWWKLQPALEKPCVTL
jgi:hypothetical protein